MMMKYRKKQRRRSRKLKYFLICTAVLIAVLGLWTFYQDTNCGVTEYTVYSDKLPEAFDGYRVLQISDLHNASFGKDNDQLVGKARQAKPDIIVITGDFADSNGRDVEVCTSLADRLCEIAPVYYVPGNHEYYLNEGKREILYAGMEESGVHMLLNETARLERGGESITLIGLEDKCFFELFKTQYMKEMLESLVPPEGFSLLLSHRPELIDIYAGCGVDLALTGHAHGGQIRLPFIGGLYASQQGWFPKYTDGLHRQGGTQMIISRGIGGTAFPFRINNPPEMVLVVLKTAGR